MNECTKLGKGDIVSVQQMLPKVVGEGLGEVEPMLSVVELIDIMQELREDLDIILQMELLHTRGVSIKRRYLSESALRDVSRTLNRITEAMNSPEIGPHNRTSIERLKAEIDEKMNSLYVMNVQVVVESEIL